MSLELPTAVTQLQIATMEGKPLQETSSSTNDLFKDVPAPVRISKQREWRSMLWRHVSSLSNFKRGGTLQNTDFFCVAILTPYDLYAFTL